MPLPEVCVCYLLRPGETPEQAIRREVAEETSIELSAVDLVGELTYPFPFRPSLSQRSWVFVSRDWEGEARESDELVPEWYPVAAIPTARMWDDARYWVRDAIAGRFVRATFEFGADLRSVAASDHPAFGFGSPPRP